MVDVGGSKDGTPVSEGKDVAAASQNGSKELKGAEIWNYVLDRETKAKMWSWNGLDEEDIMSQFLSALPERRKYIGGWLTSGYVEAALCLIILFNGFIAILETDATADGGDAPTWITVINSCLLAVYSIEIVVRVYVFHWYYLRSSWNLLDLGVVLLDVALNVLRGAIGDIPNVSVLRTVRLIRLARAIRVIVLFPELHVMVMGLAGTIKTVCWGMVLLSAFVTVFSLVAVQLVHPINKRIQWENCERCPRAFASVWDSSLTFIQQIIAGDAWGTVTVPIIDEEPWTVGFFLCVLITINLLVINLILAVVVDKAQQCHQNDQAELVRALAKEKESQHAKARTELVKMCYCMDVDKSGCITLDELLSGYDENEYFANTLAAMDIDREDIGMVFNILDKDGSGDIDYTEFVDQLHKLKSQDTHTLLIFVMHHVKELEHMFKYGQKRSIEQQVDTATSQALLRTASPSGTLATTVSATELGRLKQSMEEVERTIAEQAQLLSVISTSLARVTEAKATGEVLASV